MAPWLERVFDLQVGMLDVEVWLEPFAGGAGAALTLLDRDVVGEAWIVDANPGIHAFWATVTTDGEALAARVKRTRPTMALYDACRDVLAHPAEVGTAELGYAAFIVNRCSRSGIVALTSGPMGGRQGAGKWAIDGRFTAEALAERIRHVSSLSGRLRVFHGDGIAFLEDLDGSAGVESEILAFVDPPYVREGNRLYANGMTAADHQRLADALNGCAARWILTYDDEPVIPETLYPERRVLAYDIRNTANRARVAREYAVFSDDLILPAGLDPLSYGGSTWVRAA